MKRYLYAHNPFFRRVRDVALAAGFRYTLEDPACVLRLSADRAADRARHAPHPLPRELRRRR